MYVYLSTWIWKIKILILIDVEHLAGSLRRGGTVPRRITSCRAMSENVGIVTVLLRGILLQSFGPLRVLITELVAKENKVLFERVIAWHVCCQIELWQIAI